MSDKPAVVKHSVTIHTIKVGKKQFTASMFKQLPNLDSIFADETKSKLVGEIWGYVNLAGGIYYLVEVLGSKPGATP